MLLSSSHVVSECTNVVSDMFVQMLLPNTVYIYFNYICANLVAESTNVSNMIVQMMLMTV